MDIKIHNYRSLAKQLKRIADSLDTLTAHYVTRHYYDGINPPPKEGADPKIEITYSDPEQETIDEIRKALGQVDAFEEEE